MTFYIVDLDVRRIPIFVRHQGGSTVVVQPTQHVLSNLYNDRQKSQ